MSAIADASGASERMRPSAIASSALLKRATSSSVSFSSGSATFAILIVSTGWWSSQFVLASVTFFVSRCTLPLAASRIACTLVQPCASSVNTSLSSALFSSSAQPAANRSAALRQQHRVLVLRLFPEGRVNIVGGDIDQVAQLDDVAHCSSSMSIVVAPGSSRAERLISGSPAPLLDAGFGQRGVDAP
jgi:hypothetical protein